MRDPVHFERTLQTTILKRNHVQKGLCYSPNQTTITSSIINEDAQLLINNVTNSHSAMANSQLDFLIEMDSGGSLITTNFVCFCVPPINCN